MRHLAIDFGTKNIGIAISDEKGIIAQPHLIIKRKSDRQAIDNINEICQKLEVKKIIIGLSSFANEENQKRVQSFAQKVQEITQINIEFWDETFSTQQAQNMVEFSSLAAARPHKRQAKSHKDDVAAAIILQEFLNHEKSC
ncbi:Holliday junction resolvase RuvX [Candidatus Dojkabacteria bacterium]|nr:Holliday junction resolvase RuvX [Candidatus Dojkabacteria bacterium]